MGHSGAYSSSSAGQSQTLHQDRPYGAGTETGKTGTASITDRKPELCFYNFPPTSSTGQGPPPSHQTAFPRPSPSSSTPGTPRLHQGLHPSSAFYEQQTPYDPRVLSVSLHQRLTLGVGIPLPSRLQMGLLVQGLHELSHNRVATNF